MKKTLVQCCKAGIFQDVCKTCKHSTPHEVTPDKVCTKWGMCYRTGVAGDTVSVRCVKCSKRA